MKSLVLFFITCSAALATVPTGTVFRSVSVYSNGVLNWPTNFFAVNGITNGGGGGIGTESDPVYATGVQARISTATNNLRADIVPLIPTVGTIAASNNTDYYHASNPSGYVDRTLTNGLVGIEIDPSWSAQSNAVISHTSSAHGINGSGAFVAGVGASSEGVGAAIGPSSLTSDGASVGNGARSSAGSATGDGAQTQDGGSAGKSAYSTAGFSGGDAAYVNDGASVGKGARNKDGFSGGKDAVCTVDGTSTGSIISAIQLGTGANTNPLSLQVYGYPLMLPDGSIPEARISGTTGPINAKITNTWAITKEPSGWAADYDGGVAYSFDTNTRILRTTSSVPMVAYLKGVQITNSTDISWPAIGTNYGNWYIYWDNDSGALAASQQSWTLDDVQVASVYWQSTNALAIPYEEMHSFMPWTVHRRFHLDPKMSSAYVSGLPLSVTNGTFSLGSGAWMDEDIYHVESTTMTNCYVATREPSGILHVRGPRWQYYMTNTTGNLLYDLNGTLTQVGVSGSANYMSMWCYITPAAGTPPLWVVGRTQDTLANIRLESPPDISSVSSTAESILLFRVILRGGVAGYIETTDYRRTGVTGASAGIVAHNTLSLRNAANAHPVFALEDWQYIPTNITGAGSVSVSAPTNGAVIVTGTGGTVVPGYQYRDWTNNILMANTTLTNSDGNIWTSGYASPIRSVWLWANTNTAIDTTGNYAIWSNTNRADLVADYAFRFGVQRLAGAIAAGATNLYLMDASPFASYDTIRLTSIDGATNEVLLCSERNGTNLLLKSACTLAQGTNSWCQRVLATGPMVYYDTDADGLNQFHSNLKFTAAVTCPFVEQLKGAAK